MSYEFYADVFFLTNFYLDFLAVCTVGEILQQKKKILRYIAGCVLSSLMGCIVFVFIQNYIFYLLCIHFMINPGMVLFCFFPAERRTYGKAFLLMYFVIFLLGGSVEWFYRTVMDGRCYEICLLLSLIPIGTFLYILRQKRKNVHGFYQVIIEHNGKMIALQALYDTGNHLTDPYLKLPVHIISKDIWQRLRKQDVFAIRLVPFSSLGCENGLLETFTADRIRVTGRDGEIKISPAVLAVAEESLFEKRPYQMILNSSISIEQK